MVHAQLQCYDSEHVRQPRSHPIPSQYVLEAKQAALRHYGRLVVLAEDAAGGRRARSIHSSLAGIGASDETVRLYVYDTADPRPVFVEQFNDIPTEVVPTAGFRPEPTTRRRPALGGTSISLAYQRAAGTLGCLVEDHADDRYLLSNNHVIADVNAAPMGSRIVQPGARDGGASPRDDIALLVAFKRIEFSGANRIDAAIGALPNPADVDPDILAIGRPVNPPSAPAVGQSVRKHGRTTALTTGAVVDTSFDGFVDYGPAGMAWFEDQIVVLNNDAPFSQPGDSGSLIVDDSRHPVALLFAGDGRYTLGNPINDVLAAFGLTVA